LSAPGLRMPAGVASQRRSGRLRKNMRTELTEWSSTRGFHGAPLQKRITPR
jgi:hypothetical protein